MYTPEQKFKALSILNFTLVMDIMKVDLLLVRKISKRHSLKVIEKFFQEYVSNLSMALFFSYEIPSGVIFLSKSVTFLSCLHEQRLLMIVAQPICVICLFAWEYLPHKMQLYYGWTTTKSSGYEGLKYYFWPT